MYSNCAINNWSEYPLRRPNFLICMLDDIHFILLYAHPLQTAVCIRDINVAQRLPVLPAIIAKQIVDPRDARRYAAGAAAPRNKPDGIGPE